MVSGDKVAELILGISITGIVSSVVFLFKWVDRLDLECHDLKRDVNHVKNNYETISRAVAGVDKDADRFVSNFESRARAVDRRFIELEARLSDGEEKSISLLNGDISK